MPWWRQPREASAWSACPARACRRRFGDHWSPLGRPGRRVLPSASNRNVRQNLKLIMLASKAAFRSCACSRPLAASLSASHVAARSSHSKDLARAGNSCESKILSSTNRSQSRVLPGERPAGAGGRVSVVSICHSVRFTRVSPAAAPTAMVGEFDPPLFGRSEESDAPAVGRGAKTSHPPEVQYTWSGSRPPGEAVPTPTR